MPVKVGMKKGTAFNVIINIIIIIIYYYLTVLKIKIQKGGMDFNWEYKAAN